MKPRPADLVALVALLPPGAIVLSFDLEARNSDSLDFHWVAVWNLRAMIAEVAPKLSQVRALAIVRAHAPEITSLETQNSDSRDFHSLPVWTIAAILRNAA